MNLFFIFVQLSNKLGPSPAYLKFSVLLKIIGNCGFYKKTIGKY